MKRFFLSILVCFWLSGVGNAAETHTHTWTDENGVKHIVTITKESSKSTDSDDSASSQGKQEWQEQTDNEHGVSGKAASKPQKTETDLPPDVKPSGSFQFDINSSKPKF